MANAVSRHGLNVGRAVRCLSHGPAGVADQEGGPLAVLARGLRQSVKVCQCEVRQAPYVWRSLS